MTKIAALNADDFELIQTALNEADPEGDFLQFFDKVEQVEGKKTLTVLMKNRIKFVKDLNKNKYVVSLPDDFIIDGFEIVDSYEFVGRHRIPFANTVIKAHMEGYEIVFIIVLQGFASHSVRIIHASDATCTYYNGCLCKKKKQTTVVDDPLAEPTLEDAINDALIENPTQDPTPSQEDPHTVIIDGTVVDDGGNNNQNTDNTDTTNTTDSTDTTDTTDTTDNTDNTNTDLGD